MSFFLGNFIFAFFARMFSGNRLKLSVIFITVVSAIAKWLLLMTDLYLLGMMGLVDGQCSTVK